MLTDTNVSRRSLLRGVGAMSVPLATGCIDREEGTFPSNDIELIIPFGAGGGFDFFARLTADILTGEGYIPVDIQPRNMEGAAGITGTNHIWNADPDGYTIGIQHGNLLPLDPIANPDVVQYSVEDMTILPAVSSTIRSVAVSTDTEIETGAEFLQAASAGELMFSHQGPNSAPAQQMMALAALGGEGTFSTDTYRENSVGYSSRPDEYTALLRGDVQVLNGSYESLTQFEESGDIRFVLFFSEDESCPPEVENHRCDTLATVDADIDNTREIINVTGVQCHMYFVAPPDLPEERKRYLCESLTKAITDPSFETRAEEAGRSVSYMDCDDTRECVNSAHETFLEHESLLREIGIID